MIDLHTGRIVATSALHQWATGNDDRCAWLTECLTRHAHDDWGDLDDEDRARNNHALRHSEGRLLSSYPVPAWLAAGAADSTVW